jgi:hypothetical protein
VQEVCPSPPFGLSLSRALPPFQAAQAEKEGFDKLSANGKYATPYDLLSRASLIASRSAS